MSRLDVRNVSCWYCHGANLQLVSCRKGWLWGRCERCGKGYGVYSRTGDSAAVIETKPLQASDMHLVRRPRGRTAPPAPDDRAARRRRKRQEASGGPVAPLFETLTDGPSEVV